MATDRPSYPSDAAEKFIVRFPPGVREQIAEAARANNRSMNAEIVARLAQSFSTSSSAEAASPGTNVAETLEQLLRERAHSDLRLKLEFQLNALQAQRMMMSQNVRQMEATARYLQAEIDAIDSDAEGRKWEQLNYQLRDENKYLSEEKKLLASIDQEISDVRHELASLPPPSSINWQHHK